MSTDKPMNVGQELVTRLQNLNKMLDAIRSAQFDELFLPEHTETINTFMPTVGLGFDGQIHTIMMPTTQEITVPDKYYIVISNARRQFNVRVDKTEYDSYTIGDHYPHYEKIQ